MKKITSKKLLIALGLGILLAAGGFFYWQRTTTGIPNKIVKQANFTLYYPEDGADWRVDRKSLTYSEETRVLSMRLQGPNQAVTINQQATPAAFTDIANYYAKLLDKLHQYSEFQTGIGRVTLTRPEELKGGQSAVVSVRDTLMFANPERDMSDAEWRQFFDSLKPYK